MNRKQITACAAGAAIGAWGIAENTLLLCTAEYEVPVRGLPRLVQISDLHKRRFGAHQRRLLEKTAALRPELIVITGDLISRTARDFTETGRLLRGLSGIAPVLAVPGNHEADLPPELYRAYRQTVRESGAVWLANQTVLIHGIPFAGLALPHEYYRGGGRFGFIGRKAVTAETLRRRLGTCMPGTVLLAHNPLWFPAYAEWGAALTLSGHVHGGAVRLPAAGGILSPERRLFPKYDKGCFTEGSSVMIVSGGLGKLRLFNPPELCVISGSDAESLI
ncbi:MAG: metallophosphoesterase [Oscillospiraceae bacterium]|nr:metallophosphoesterase [Oscillospiraceae bacterium]